MPLEMPGLLGLDTGLASGSHYKLLTDSSFNKVSNAYRATWGTKGEWLPLTFPRLTLTHSCQDFEL